METLKCLCITISIYPSISYQSIGQNYNYTEKYSDVQGIRLANSSEFDSSHGVGESRENIKLRDISNEHGDRKSKGEVNICHTSTLKISCILIRYA